MPARRPRRKRAPWWAKLPYDELLDVRIRDLELAIDGTALEQRVAQLHDECERAGLRVRPYVWLSTDWFTPDGITGFAIPFFLAHPRLARIEHRQMFEVEGGNHDWCMRLLRHEAGHVIDNAYRLHRTKAWRETFGLFGSPYLSTYVPNPSSRDYVHNLDFWYAQSHPAEDWSETFAVWLQSPRGSWRRRYAGWGALKKLEWVDETMERLAATPPKVRTRAKPDSLSSVSMTLRDYYRRKQATYGADQPLVPDDHLLNIFTTDRASRRYDSAGNFLRRHRLELRARVAAGTGQYRYVVDQALNLLMLRCRQLGLRLARPARATLVDAAILLTVTTMSVLRLRGQPYRR